MVHFFRGDPKGAVGYFNENINTENYQYYSYFKALALQGSGQEESATEIFRQLANYNFNGLGISLVRSLAKQRLEKS